MPLILKLQPKDKLKFWILFGIIFTATLYILPIRWSELKDLGSFIHFYSFYKEYKLDTVQPKLLVVWGSGYGEREQKQRIKIAAERIGIAMKSVSNTTPEHAQDLFKWQRNKYAAKIYKPNMVLIIEGWEPIIPGFNNYVTLAWPANSFIGKDFSKYTGVLPVFNDFNSLPANTKIIGNWYPSTYKTDFIPHTPKKLFYLGGTLYDKTRGSDKYKKLFILLDKTGYLAVYGNQDKWQHTPNSLQTTLPFDGKSILQTANAAGITLVLHAQEHFDAGMPTGRIFEAAAANTVIISDKNKFVLDNFGDNVLYIDIDKDAETIFQQIDAHMQWIFANPVKSQAMANKCHVILNEKFNLEDQLNRLLAVR